MHYLLNMIILIKNEENFSIIVNSKDELEYLFNNKSFSNTNKNNNNSRHNILVKINSFICKLILLFINYNII